MRQRQGDFSEFKPGLHSLVLGLKGQEKAEVRKGRGLMYILLEARSKSRRSRGNASMLARLGWFFQEEVEETTTEKRKIQLALGSLRNRRRYGSVGRKLPREARGQWFRSPAPR